MARKKHHKKHTHRRRSHSMSGVQGMATNAAAVVAGAVIGRFVGNMLNTTLASSTSLSSYTKYIGAAAPIALGILTPKLVKSEFGKGLGTGMIAVGGLTLFQALGVVSGLPAVSGMRRVGMAPNNMNPRGTISGLDTKSAAVLTA